MISEKHEVLLRMRAIELLALWEGRVITTRLVDWYGVSRQQASIDIKRYTQERNPGALVYSPAAKGYIPAAEFSPVLTRGEVNEYLDLISGVANEPFSVTLESKNEHLCAVQLPDRSVKPDVLRKIIKAIRTSAAIEITYASMNNPTPHQRIISPHTLIYSGFRWHVRAFCHTRNSFRDFVLSRIHQPVDCDEQYVSIADDSLWNESVTLSLIANCNLSNEQQRLVENDFGMKGRALEITVRKALVHYTLQRYQAAISADDRKEAFKFPIMVSDASTAAVQNFLFEGAVND